MQRRPAPLSMHTSASGGAHWSGIGTFRKIPSSTQQSHGDAEKFFFFSIVKAKLTEMRETEYTVIKPFEQEY